MTPQTPAAPRPPWLPLALRLCATVIEQDPQLWAYIEAGTRAVGAAPLTHPDRGGMSV